MAYVRLNWLRCDQIDFRTAMLKSIDLRCARDTTMAKQSRRPVDILVGSRIKQARHAVKISQTELGRALDVTFQQVQKYEKGSNRVSAGALQIIAERLKVPVPWLMGLKADGHSAKGADGKIESVMGTRDGYAIVETLAQMDKKTVAAVREIVAQIAKLV
jgi:transcriptional regulator with XRE-family HTH domain